VELPRIPRSLAANLSPEGILPKLLSNSRAKMNSTLQQNNILFLKDVITKTTLSKTTIYRFISDPNNDFPRPVRLGVKRIGWLSSAIENYILTRQSL
jgi:predicted DNA-binding transcriptional regulator AlpA